MCKGALGDPIRKIDFGQGPTQRGGPIVETSFRFEPTGTPNDGWYTIAKSTNGMHPGNWHQISNHTPNDPDGYMMIINASDEPSVFYEAPVPDLCPNTTYQFSAWVINLLTYDGRKPNLTFIIETDQQIFTHETGNIDEGSATNWIEHGLSFTTSADVSNIKIKIRNNGQGGNGNDLALDDITFRPCGPEIIPSVNGVITTSKNLCEGDTKNLSLSAEVTPGVYINPQYLWQEMDAGGLWQDMPAETTNQYIKPFANAIIGSYRYRLLVADNGNINSPSCRASSPTFELNVSPFPPTPTGNGPITVCVGEPINLTVSDGSTYKWTGPAGFNQNVKSPVIPVATLDMTGTYHVTIANDGGCEASTSVEVNVIPRPEVVIDPIPPICKGNSVILNARAQGGISYSWTPATGLSATDIENPEASPTKTTVYTVLVSNGYCTTPASITVEVIKDLNANAGGDLKIIKGNAIKLNGAATGPNIAGFFWTPSDYLDDPTKVNPIAKPPINTTYTLNVISSTGCSTATDEVFVKVYDKLIVPNSFSPNGDGINDLWNVVAIDTYINPTVKVMNRYGQLIFEGKGNKTAWDGKRGHEDVPVGVYYYMIYLEPGLKPLTGSLMVIR